MVEKGCSRYLVLALLAVTASIPPSPAEIYHQRRRMGKSGLSLDPASRQERSRILDTIIKPSLDG